MPTERHAFARELRRRATEAEDVLWQLLRGGRVDGLKFRRQAPLLAYTVDFLCFGQKLVVELDGRQHDAAVGYDRVRTEEIERHGFSVIRFRNEQVLGDRDAVIAAIREAVSEARGTPLLKGEGQG